MTDRAHHHERRAETRRAAGRLPLRALFAEARLFDLSAGGFAIETRQGLTIGQVYDFACASDLGPLRFRGEVKWCALRATERRPGGDVAPLFRAGMRRRPASQYSPKDALFIDFSPPAA